jgi:UDP:flavonoid glycosyltransferase YjiC (YdhE family)
MKFAVAVHGTRGDVEPCAAVALELRRRGHEVRMAVPPNLTSFADGAGLPPSQAYGVDSELQMEADIFRKWWKPRNPVTVIREAREYVVGGWAEMSQTLVTLSDRADLILTGTTYQEVAANVAEHRGIPLAALHYFPHRPNAVLFATPLPASVTHSVWAAGEWAHWRVMKDAEDEQRRALGLRPVSSRAAKRIADHALEIQAYDRTLFPGLADEWAGRRPFVGALTLQLGTDEDAEVAAWIDEGSPPIYFGFGSMPIDSPADAVEMISTVCASLGHRALISSGTWDSTGIAHHDHVKIVRAVNHAEVFPRCRAVVHHGGAGTTAAGIRAGVPALVLWVNADQPVFARQVRRLGIGESQRFSATSPRSLADRLRSVLAPHYAERARALAAEVTPAAVSVSTTADLLEEAAAARGADGGS